MQIVVSMQAPELVGTPLLVVPLAGGPSGVDLGSVASLDPSGVLASAVAAGDFRAKKGDRVWAYGSARGRSGAKRSDAGPERVLFLGVGERSELTAERLREVAGQGVRAAERRRLSSLGFCVAHLSVPDPQRWGQSVAEGLALAAWRFDELKSAPAAEEGEADTVVTEAIVVANGPDGWEDGVRTGAAFAEGTNTARTLQARPGNVATPAHLASEAERIAAAAGLVCRILGPDELAAQKMRALLSVARGSDQEPRLIVLRYAGGPADESPLVLVGKGLTFDAGGISIKPAKGMEDMKYDMSGGAAVLGAMQAIGRLRLPVNVTGVIPCSENLLNGSANKPGDIVRGRAGKTIEIINTDAEGRLILADALHYATEWKPAAVVDCATLTGACVIALGHHRSAVLGNDEELIEQLRRAGDSAGQPCWPLPLDDAYRKQLESDFADLKNVGGRAGGTITAGWFLAEFVGDVPWAHLDIAGTAYGKTKKAYLRDGPSGNPCRLLLEWVRSRAAR